jgi:hypothetical protein
MPRRLSDESNELRIRDNISGSILVIYYRMPETDENVRYTNEAIQRHRNKLVNRLGQVRQKYGLAILTGFREGDFEVKGPNGNGWAPLKMTDPDWKKKLAQHAPDIIEALAIHVFESGVESVDDPDDDNLASDDGPESGEKLEKNYWKTSGA